MTTLRNAAARTEETVRIEGNKDDWRNFVTQNTDTGKK
jgi:hypothetical protein